MVKPHIDHLWRPMEGYQPLKMVKIYLYNKDKAKANNLKAKAELQKDGAPPLIHIDAPVAIKISYKLLFHGCNSLKQTKMEDTLW